MPYVQKARVIARETDLRTLGPCHVILSLGLRLFQFLLDVYQNWSTWFSGSSRTSAMSCTYKSNEKHEFNPTATEGNRRDLDKLSKNKKVEITCAQIRKKPFIKTVRITRSRHGPRVKTGEMTRYGFSTATSTQRQLLKVTHFSVHLPHSRTRTTKFSDFGVQLQLTSTDSPG